MMETFLANAYTCLDKKCKLFKATSIAIGNKNYSKERSTPKNFIFLQNGNLESLYIKWGGIEWTEQNRINGGDKMIFKLSCGN